MKNIATKKARAVVYLRTATRHQAGPTKDVVLKAQRQACRKRARRLGASIVGEYLDYGVSGLQAQRPGLDALLDRLQQDDIDVVIAADPARMARSPELDLRIRKAITDQDAEIFTSDDENICDGREPTWRL